MFTDFHILLKLSKVVKVKFVKQITIVKNCQNGQTFQNFQKLLKLLKFSTLLHVGQVMFPQSDEMSQMSLYIMPLNKLSRKSLRYQKVEQKGGKRRGKGYGCAAQVEESTQLCQTKPNCVLLPTSPIIKNSLIVLIAKV